MAEQNKEKGFVAVYRSLQDHWVWQLDGNEKFSKGQAWIDLLLLVNHDERKILFDGKLIKVEKGSRIISIRQLCDRWNWSNTKVVNFLNNLESDGMIVRKSDTKKTVVSIVNYSDYQSLRDTKTTQKRQSSDTETTQKRHRNTQTTIKTIKPLETISNKDIGADKKRYGEAKNVLLKDEEVEKLKQQFPLDYKERIENLSIYMGSTGKTYKDHYLTILSWARREKKQDQSKRKEKVRFEEREYGDDYYADLINNQLKDL